MMNPNLHLNEHSLQLINNIWINAQNHPMSQGYQVIKDSISYSDAGAIAMKLISPAGTGNMFLFYPSIYRNGKI